MKPENYCMKKQVEEWLEYAEIDLRSARKLLEDDTLTQSAAFHIHQTVEKSFKAIIENFNKKIPKIHDLEKLLEIITENGLKFNTNTDPILKINNIYIEARYPGDQGLMPNGTPSVSFVEEIYDFADKIYNEIKTILK
jgi:HEPN domain-containing protein